MSFFEITFFYFIQYGYPDFLFDYIYTIKTLFK